MKVVVDIYGGDNAPLEIIKGCVIAINDNKDLTVVMCGKENEIKEILKGQKFNKFQVEIIDAQEVILNTESPTTAIKTKNNSSLVVALEKTRDDDNVVGMVSAGCTGAILTGALLKIGRIKGVKRPALAPVVPNAIGGKTLLIDSGANMDSKAFWMCQHAIMGSAYMEEIYGIKSPRVALLNVGTEDKKGNMLCKKAFAMLKALPINFVGNMEARDFLSGKYDVVVADGFSGNVLLKSTEGAVMNLLAILKEEIMKSTKCKLGALLLKPAFKSVKSRLAYSEFGGAPFLGVKKTVVKAHGSSKATSIAVAIDQVYNMGKQDVNAKIEDELKKVVIEDDE